MASIELRGISKSFGAVTVLRDVTLAVADGEFVALLGPSGCGKSTLIRIVAGLERPDSGEVRIGARVVDDGRLHVPPERRGLGMVFQSYAVWPHKTVLENVLYPLRLHGVAGDDAAARARRALGLVHLDGLEGRYPHELSGGQQQRVALARALVAEPAVLLLDEPLSNLDARLREEMRAEIGEIRDRLGVTVLFVTHDQAEALASADRVAVMRAGRIAQVGTPSSLYDDPKDLYVAEVVGAVNALPVRRIRASNGTDRAVPGDLDVETESGLLATVPGWEPRPPPNELVLAVRPEDLEVGEGAARARVLSRAYVGSRVELALGLGDAKLRATVRSVGAPGVGEILGVRVTRARLIPRNS